MGEFEDRLARLSPAQRALLERKLAARRTAEVEGEAAPMTHAQERFWLLEQIHPGEPAHHLVGTLECSGSVDLDALEASIRAVVARHPPLRTTFVADPLPRPRTRDAAQLALHRVDLSHATPADAAAARLRILDEVADRPFDLAEDLPLRVTSLRLPGGRVELLTCVHHIAADGLSLRNFGREIALAYPHFANGSPPPWPELRTSYAAHARAERAAGVDPAALASLVTHFAGADPAAAPADRVRRVPGVVAGGRVTLTTEAGTLARVRRTAASMDATPFELLLTIFHAWLLRVGHGTDLVVGIPEAGRDHRDLEPLIGLFVRSLPLRTDGSGALTFAELLQRTSAEVARARRHAAVPFEALVEALADDRHLDRNPVFQVMFNYVDFATWEHDLGGGLALRYRPETRGALLDLTLFATRRGDDLDLAFEFDAGRFDRATVHRYLEQVQVVLQGALRAPEHAVAALPLIPGDELRSLLAFEPGPEHTAPLADVVDAVRAHARERPAGIAVADALGATSYAELIARAEEIAQHLLPLELPPSTPVAHCLERSRDLPAVMLGVAMADLAFVPLDPTHPAARLGVVLEDVDARAVLVTKATAHLVPADRRAVRIDLPPDRARALSARSGGLAYVLHTSGSTGRPKGVRVPHRALANLLSAVARRPGLDRQSTLLAVTTVSFDISILELLAPLWAGGTVVVADRDVATDPRRLADAIAHHSITTMQATPATWRMLELDGWPGGRDLAAWCGGEVLPADLAKFLERCCGAVWNLYGPTETTIWSTCARFVEPPVTVGQPLQGTTVRVVDPSSGARRPIGVPGEIWIGGDGLALGYHHRDDENATRFVTHEGVRYYRTGDVGRWRADGQLVCLGRDDDQLKIRGYRVEPGEIEIALRADRAVLDAAVAAVGEATATALHAWVVPDPGDAAPWRDVWTAAYARAEPGQPSGQNPDFAGWTSAFDGEPIPDRTMSAWRDDVGRRLADLEPRRVLEVGCGTGLLIEPILTAGAESYLGLDPVAAVVERLNQRYAQDPRMRLREGTAAILGNNDTGFDTIVVHSVIQYLPGGRALVSLLRDLLGRLVPGGSLWVGDVRHRGTLRHMHRAILEQRGLEPDEDAVDRSANADPELCVSPELFETVARAAGCAVSFQLRQGVGDRELAPYRYDVVLRARTPTPAPDSVRWTVLDDLDRAQRDTLSLVGIPNARIAPDAEGAIDPDAIYERVQQLGLRGSVRPSADGASFDLICGADEGGQGTPISIKVRELEIDPGPYCHEPSPPIAAGVRERLAARLPAHMVPSRIHVVPALPQTTAGKIDRRALAESLASTAAASASSATTAAGDTERVLCSLFQDLLHVPDVGPDDDFFALGGHSLLAARLANRIRESLDMDLRLVEVFSDASVRGLARTIDSARQSGRRAAIADLPRDSAPGLSPAQERLWFLQRLAPDDPAYNMAAALELRGPLDRRRLQHAVDRLTERHPVLATPMPPGDDGRPRCGAPLRIEIARADDQGDWRAYATAPFDLATEPPLRLALRQVAPDHHDLLACVHHVACDGWSLAVALRDLAAAYDHTPLPAAPSYWDYAAWLRESTGAHGALADWFARALADSPPILDLPADRPRPARLDSRGQRILHVWSPELSRAVRDAARSAGTTPFVWLLTAFEILLARLADQKRFAVGTAVAQRPHRRAEDLVGLCVNTLALPAAVDLDAAFADHLRANAELVLGALDHRDAPLSAVIDALQPPRNLGRTPLFQVTFDLLNQPPADPESFRTLNAAARELPIGRARFDLSLRIHDEAAFRCEWEWRAELWDEPTVAAWARSMEALVESALAEPQLAAGHLGATSSFDAERLEATGDGGPPKAFVGVLPRIVQRASTHPDELAIRDGELALGYGALLDRARTIASTLRECGVTPGDRVALALPRSAELIAACLAVWGVGAAFVPLDPEDPDARRRAILDDADVRTVWDGSAAATARQEPMDAADAAAIAYVLYTSGTTGKPKGVEISHGALDNYIAAAADRYCAKGRGAPLHGSPSFDLTLTSMFAPLIVGHPVTVVRDGSARALGDVLRAAEETFAFVKLTPTHLRLLQHHADGPPVGGTRALVVGGEALDGASVATWVEAGVAVFNEYGPTEATVACTAYRVGGNDVSTPGTLPIGTPLRGATVSVRDDRLRDVPFGAVGEICIGGAGLALGYRGLEAETARAFVTTESGERLYRTGDRGRIDAQGNLRFLGRSDGQRKLRGYRMELDGIEAALRRVAGAADACADVRRIGDSDRLIAWVTPASLDEATVREALRAQLPAWMLPSHVQAMDALPRGAGGKVDRASLPDPLAVHVDTAAIAGEDAVVAAFRAVLRRVDVAVTDGFFELGGDSILALDLVAWLDRRGHTLALEDVFRAQTPRAMARCLGAAALEDDLEGPPTPLPIQAWFAARNLPAPSRVLQAITLEIEPGARDRWVEAIEASAHRHRSFRLRLRHGTWSWAEGPLPGVVGTAAPTAAEAASAASRRIDIERGPTLAAAEFPAAGGRVGIVVMAHHIAIDAASWRVLAREWVDTVETGAPRTRAASPTGFARALAAARESGRWRRERAHWNAVDLGAGLAHVPRGTHADAIETRWDLDRECTTALLGRALQPLRLHPQEVLLGALAAAVGDALGMPSGSLSIDVEGHGRDLGDGLRAPAAVGWFTVLYPVAPINVSDDLVETVRSAKDAWRRTPGQGEGFAASGLLRADRPRDVLFNFLGEIGGAAETVRIAPWWGSQLQNPDNPLSHAIECIAWIESGQLRTILRIDGRLEDLTDELPQRFEQRLRRAVEDLAQTPHQWTLGDFPQLDLRRDELDELTAAHPELEDAFPATPTQAGMVLHQRAHPDTEAHFEQLAVVVRGAIDSAALRRAFVRLIRRHDTLRSAIRTLGDRLCVVVDADAALDWHECEGPASPPDARAAFLRDRLRLRRSRPFDLERAPLLAVELVHCGDSTALMLSYHHVILDGWSTPVLLEELMAIYGEERGGPAAELAPVRPFADHARSLATRDAAAAEAFWREELADVTGPTPLGFADPPAGHTVPHEECERAVSEATTAAAIRCGQGLGITIANLAQAVWALVLARCADATEALFGATVSGRPPDAARGVGLYINTIAVRVPVPERGRVDEWLRDVQRRAGERVAFEHFALPRAQAIAGLAGASRLFESLVVFENYPVADDLRAPDGLELEHAFGFERTSYPVTLVIVPGARWTLRLLFDPARVPPARAARVLHWFERALAQACAPDADLGEISLLDHAEERALVHMAHQRAPRAPALRDLLEAGLLTNPDALAVDGEHTLTRRELWHRAGRLAAAIRAYAPGPIAVPLPRGGAQLTAVLACVRAGVPWLPVDEGAPPERLTAMLETARPTAAIADGTSWRGLPTVAMDHDTGDAHASTSATACVLFTSGSTGRPRGVPVGTDALAHFCVQARAAYGLGPADRVLLFASPTFDASLEEALVGLAAGATLIPRPELRAIDAFFAFVAEQRITVLDLPTAFWHTLVDALDDAVVRRLDGVRLVILGGEAVDPARLARWWEREPAPRLVNSYGPVEATVVAAIAPLDRATPRHAIPIGRPLPGIVAWVLDKNGRPAPWGVTGELHLGGPTLCTGYLRDDAATEARFGWHPFARQRLYATGDRVRWNEADELVFVGRTDREWKVRGQRVAPEEIEAVLRAYPRVSDAKVDRPDPNGPIVAWCATSDPAPHPDTLRDHVARHLPRAAVPDRIGTLPALPRNHHGKIDVSTLATPEPPRAEDDGPTSPLVAELQELLGDVLGHPVGAHQSFFDAGGDSLAAVTLATRIERRFGNAVPFEDLLQAPTATGLARAIASGTATAPDLDRDLSLVDRHLRVSPARGKSPEAVVLTGATGFLGAHLVRELAERATRVVCVVRASDPEDARRRVRANALHHLGVAPSLDHVAFVCGDIAAERMGLNPEDWAQLTAAADAVVHNAASTSFLAPYERLRNANVVGTARALELAAVAGATMHYVSTIGIATDAAHPVEETHRACDLPQPRGGYPASKWVAEQLVERAAAAGLATHVHRPGRLVPEPGRPWPADDLTAAFLKTCLAMGQWPESDRRPDLTPVGFVARAVAEAVFAPAEVPGRLHLFHPTPPTATELRERLNEAGADLEPVPAERWLADVRARAADPRHSLHVLLPWLGSATPLTDGIEARAVATTAFLTSRNLACPPITAADLAAHLGSLNSR